jgi:hypothetical protein
LSAIRDDDDADAESRKDSDNQGLFESLGHIGSQKKKHRSPIIF